MTDDEIVTAIVLELGADFKHQPWHHDFQSDRTVVYFALKKYTTPWVPSTALLDACMLALLGEDFEYH